MFLLHVIALGSVAATEIQGLSYTIDLESSLRQDLFPEYEILQKPAETVDVNVSLSLIALHDMDIKTQTFSISGYFSFKWQDDRLMWSHNTSLSSVRFLFINSKYMWVPPIDVENAIDDIVPLGSENVFTKIYPNGYVSWLPGDNIEATCEAEVTFYPLDTQTCILSLATM